MLTLMNHYLCMYLFTMFFMCCSYSMNQESKEPSLHASGASTLIAVRNKNSSPGLAQNVVLEVQSPSPLANSLINAQAPPDNAERKHMFEVRISCCQKVMKCSGLTLAATLVITTGAIGYYLKSLATTCSDLTPLISQIRDYAREVMPLVRQGIAMASQFNATQLDCRNANIMCQNAHWACTRPL